MITKIIKELYFIIKTYIFKIKPKISSGDELTKNELKYILKDKINPKNIFIADNKTSLLDKKSVERFLANSKVNFYKYKKEIFDCDDFSFVLMGEARKTLVGGAFGIIWTYNHALNCFIDTDKNIWFVEPQTDKLTLAENYSKKIYLVLI